MNEDMSLCQRERGMRTCYCVSGERDEDMSQCQGRGMRTCHCVRGEEG